MEKRKILLNLTVLALNEAIRRGVVDLAGRSDAGNRQQEYFTAEIGGKNTVIMCSDIGHDELRISVWWDYVHDMHPRKDAEKFMTSTPLAKKHNFSGFVGACVSCWLERKTGKYIMGRDGNHLFDMYVRVSSAKALSSLPAEKPLGFETGGQFYF